jgi:uncharacterized protein (TIGR00251 family)
MGFRAISLINLKQKIFSKKLLIYKVNVQFSKEFLEIEEDRINIGIKSKPIKGEANKEIIKKIAKHFKISTNSVQIKSGHKSSEKIIEILQ